MEKTVLCIVVLVFIYMQMYIAQASSKKSHYGNQFYIGMVAARNWTTDFQIDVVSNSSVNMHLNIPYLNVHRNESLQKGSTTVAVNNSLIRQGNFKENRGIFLSTDVPVAIYVTWQAHPKVMDTYLALPVSSLGTRYIVASYDPCSVCTPDTSEMMIVGSHDNTSVTVTDPNKKNTTLNLNAFDAYQLSNSKDLSNTAISSDKPVTLITGTSCANIPHGVFQCDMLLEQMIPSYAWKKTYIISPVFPKLGFVLRIFSERNAAVCLTNSTVTVCYHSYKEEYLMGTDPVVVTSNFPISVVQYGVGERYDFIDADEFMTVIPGVENYLNNYHFVIPNIYSNLDNWLSIVVPAVDAGGIRLDGSSLTPDRTYSVPDPLSNYTVIITNLTVGYHELMHIDDNVMFGVSAYGLGPGIGYGFPVGFSLESYPKSTTTTSTSTSTSTTASSTSVPTSSTTTSTTPSTSVSTSTASTSTTSSTTSSPSGSVATFEPITNVSNLMCFSCNNMSHVELCDVVKHCGTDEVCYVESYEQFGRTLYKSGCLQTTTCLHEMEITKGFPDRCAECCSHDYCNSRGCGDSGLAPRDQRGPVCYDCPYELTPQECSKLTLCQKDEVCITEEFRWGDHSHFKLGCAHGQCIPSTRSVHIATRTFPVCRSCCGDDYCNRNCTKAEIGSIIIG